MVKSYIISVSLCTGCYRHIRISASATLFRLHQAILNAFDFEDDHAHGFFMDNRIWSHYDAYFSMELKGDERLTTEYTLESLKLQIGDKFKYLFDFGDEWVFQCKVLRKLEEATDLPGVVRSVGNAPGQHQGEDWDINEEDAEGELPARYKPDRIKVMFQALTLPKAVTENLRRYFDAAANLYGIIPVKKLLEIYNSQNSPVSQEDFLAVAEILRHSDTAFYILGEEELYRDGKASSPLNWKILSIIKELITGTSKKSASICRFRILLVHRCFFQRSFFSWRFPGWSFFDWRFGRSICLDACRRCCGGVLSF